MSLDVDVSSPIVHTHVDPAPASNDLRRSPPLRPPLVIGPNVSMTGILRVDGEVRIESDVEADIRCDVLLVAPHARIDGVIVADHVDIFGHVDGEIYCNRATVRNEACVHAELYYGSLELEPGGFFEGRSRHHKSPLSLSPKFD